MADNRRVRCMLLCVVLSGLMTSCVGVQCHSCSYQFAGTGEIDFKCVNDTLNHDKISRVPCAPPNVCNIQATYTMKFTRLSSLVRDCSSHSIPALNKTVCTKLDGHGGANCYFQCDSELCNLRNGDLHADYDPNVAPGLTSLPSLLALSLLSITFSKLIMV